MPRPHRTPVLLLLCLCAGCAATQPLAQAPLDRGGLESRSRAAMAALDGQSVQSSHPAEHFIVGRGEAQAGARAQAEDVARARVAQQIQSRIDSQLQLEDSEHYASVDGRESLEQREVRRRVIRQHASFGRNELIRIDPQHSGCDAQRCWAVALLDRREAAAEYEDEVNTLAAQHQAAARRAAAGTSDPLQFSPPYRLARRSFDQLLARSATLHGILGQTPGQVTAARSTQAELEQRRSALLTGLQLTVRETGTASPEGTALANALVEALRGAGLQARRGPSCQQGLALSPAVNLHCEHGYVGHQCTLQGELQVTRCGEPATLRSVTLGDPTLAGLDPRSQQGARERALLALAGAEARAHLLQRLNDVLPL